MDILFNSSFLIISFANGTSPRMERIRYRVRKRECVKGTERKRACPEYMVVNSFCIHTHKMHNNDGLQLVHSIQMWNQKWIVTVLRTYCVVKTSVTLKVRNEIKWALNTRSQCKHTFWPTHLLLNRICCVPCQRIANNIFFCCCCCSTKDERERERDPVSTSLVDCMQSETHTHTTWSIIYQRHRLYGRTILATNDFISLYKKEMYVQPQQ